MDIFGIVIDFIGVISNLYNQLSALLFTEIGIGELTFSVWQVVGGIGLITFFVWGLLK